VQLKGMGKVTLGKAEAHLIIIRRKTDEKHHYVKCTGTAETEGHLNEITTREKITDQFIVMAFPKNDTAVLLIHLWSLGKPNDGS
jgi:hypothetical protein